MLWLRVSVSTQDHGYFAKILKQMEEGGRAAMLYDLQQEDLSKFNQRQVPSTRGLQDQKVLSMQPHEGWWFKRLQLARLIDDHAEWRREVVKDDLVSACVEATRQPYTVQNLQRMLSKLLPQGYPAEGPRPTIDGERKRTWLLPSLEECRAHFQKMFKLDDPWEEAE